LLRRPQVAREQLEVAQKPPSGGGARVQLKRAGEGGFRLAGPAEGEEDQGPFELHGPGPGMAGRQGLEYGSRALEVALPPKRRAQDEGGLGVLRRLREHPSRPDFGFGGIRIQQAGGLSRRRVDICAPRSVVHRPAPKPAPSMLGNGGRSNRLA
jgi:hypothetical protein